MLDRASTFSDPKVVELLKTKFVPVAIDQAYQRRQKDAEGRFYQKIANQGPRKIGNGGPTTQGNYTAAPDGTFLGYNNNRRNQELILNPLGNQLVNTGTDLNKDADQIFVKFSYLFQL